MEVLSFYHTLISEFLCERAKVTEGLTTAISPYLCKILTVPQVLRDHSPKINEACARVRRRLRLIFSCPLQMFCLYPLWPLGLYPKS